MKERVLITGGMAGIGAATAEACRAAGLEPVIIDRLPGGIVADLSSAEATAEALERALAGGPITRLVNNVGIVVPAAAEAQTLAELELAWSLNVRTALQCVQALVPGMKASGFGRVVSMSSRVLALELGPFGITANAIGPGPIRTELFDRANPPGSPRTQAIIDGIPVKRVGTPADVARAVMFFLDRENGFVTGQTLYVCGGLTVGVAQV